MDLDKLMEYLIVTDQADEFLGLKKEDNSSFYFVFFLAW